MIKCGAWVYARIGDTALHVLDYVLFAHGPIEIDFANTLSHYKSNKSYIRLINTCSAFQSAGPACGA